MARLTFLIIAACVSYATASVLRGDGELPALELDEPSIRTIYGNTTVPWEENETTRIRVLSEDANAIVEFNCKKLPDICQNMCYGITCRKLPDTLKKNSAGAAGARKRNSCGNVKPNRCSQDYGGKGKGPKGQSCDEYPFASTVQGQNTPTNVVTRCVPKEQNSSQGGTLSHVPDHSTYDVRLDFGKGPVLASSGGGTGYCSAKTSTDPVCNTLTGTQQNS